MNILYILQQSIYNNDGKWISADSNINMMIGVLRELVKKTNWNFYILISPLEDFVDLKDYTNLISDFDNFCQIHFISYKFPINAFLNRQHFDIFEFDKKFKMLPKIDIVWNNITELSRNIKTYLYFNSPKTKLITCCYWLDCPDINQVKVDSVISYKWRQFDGFECSDLAVFTCKSTFNAFIENSNKCFNSQSIEKIKNKSVIWDFGFSTKEIDRYKTNKKFNKKTILFLNRLSGINYTHHKEFIKAINFLYKKRQDFQVIFTNPSGKYSFEELKNEVVPLYIYSENSLNREEYINLLYMADISVHLYLNELYGGVAHRESIYCDNIVVTPKVYEYLDIQKENYPFYVKNDFSDLEDKLNNALNCNFENIKKSFTIIKNNTVYQSSFESISDRVIKNILEVNFNDK